MRLSQLEMLDADYLFTNKFLNTIVNNVDLMTRYRSLNDVTRDTTNITCNDDMKKHLERDSKVQSDNSFSRHILPIRQFTLASPFHSAPRYVSDCSPSTANNLELNNHE